jgi:hypothetical protein
MTATTTNHDPMVSIVVTIVDGGDVLRRFLDALVNQVDAPPLDVVVPYDSSIREIATMAPEYPAFRFLDIGDVPTIRPISTAAGQHELYDRRRAAGLHQCRGELLGILEDRAPPRPDWARTMVRLHRQLPNGAIGGAIECARKDVLNWAFYACDFSRYALPFDSGARTWVSDVNVCYKRKAIESTKDIWHERFNEARVHWALQDRGETLWLASEVVVDYRTPYDSLGAVLPERFHWGRLFGHVRAKYVSLPRRLAYVATGPVIPLVLFVRHGMTQKRKGRFGQFLKAAPTMLMLLSAWTSGEVWGYITKRP